jgi:hypothetical protein
MSDNRGARSLQILIRYVDGRLEPLSQLSLPEGWIGEALITELSDGSLAHDYPTRPALQGFRGVAGASSELSENIDTVLRLLAARNGNDESDA